MIRSLLVSLVSVIAILSHAQSTGLILIDLQVVSGSEREEVRRAVELCQQGSYSNAVEVLRTVAAEGDVDATYLLARLTATGQGTAADLEKAAALFETNVNAEHAPSMLALGELKESGSPGEALGLYRQAYFHEEPLAFLKLGYIYEQGLLGTSAKPKLALFYYKKLAEMGSPDGNYNLARCYDMGIGVSPDDLLATKLYRKAALGNHVPAQVVMARRYFGGKGVDPDPVAAVGWLTLASQFGSAEAQVLLGLRYENGDAVKQDLNRAGQLYTAAAKQGDPTGRFHLGRLYANGMGTQPDPVRAYVLYAGAQDLPAAKEALASLESTLTPEQLDLARQKLAKQQGEEGL